MEKSEKDQCGEDVGVAFTSKHITVEPLSVSGNEVTCDIEGPGVTDNAIFIDEGVGYDVTFELVSGAGGTYTFDSARPFCNHNKKCPEPPGGNATSPFSVTNNTGRTITVRVVPKTGREVSYYRLDFNGSFYCDPIIIRD